MLGMALCVCNHFLTEAKDTEQIANNSVIEIQAFLVEVIGRFELTMTELSEKVSRGPGIFMVPVVEDELKCSSLLPLAVSVAAREDDA